jgi:hypothetical protein
MNPAEERNPAMEDKVWEQHRATFEKRGVSREVAERRPYVRYERGERAITDELFASIPPRQRGATVTRRVNYSGGWLMPRHAVGTGLRPILPEFGPADELEEQTQRHDHTWPPAWVKHILGRGHDGVNVDGVHEHEWIKRPNHRHGSVDPEVWARHVDGVRSGHNGRGRRGLHQHASTKKYLHAPKPWVFVPVTKVDHRHGERSARKWHSEGDTTGEHQHVAYVKDPKNSYAQRLDMHPDTLAVLPTARRVFWCIEGVLKNDSLVTAGEATFDVPAVGQWDAQHRRRCLGASADRTRGRKAVEVCRARLSVSGDQRPGGKTLLRMPEEAPEADRVDRSASATGGRSRREATAEGGGRLRAETPEVAEQQRRAALADASELAPPG